MATNMLSFVNRVVLVTGAGNGTWVGRCLEFLLNPQNVESDFVCVKMMMWTSARSIRHFRVCQSWTLTVFVWLS